MLADGTSMWATYIHCSQNWFALGWKVQSLCGKEADRHLVETLSVPQIHRKSDLWRKVLPGLTKDFCRIRKFQNINLESLVALVKPQTSQILKVSGELDDVQTFNKKTKILGIYFSWINSVYLRVLTKCLKSGSDF